MSAIFTSARNRSGLGRIVIGTAAAALGLLAVGLSSCSTSEQRYHRRLASTGKPALHSVQSERLRDIMARLRFDPMPQETDSASERERQMREAADVAAAMAEAARSIPDAVGSVQLAETDRAVFLKLADKLGEQARELSATAKGGDYAATGRSLERVQATCNACHSLFRIDPGMAK